MTKGRFPDQPVITQHGVRAVVKWFNPTKGFGFVQLSEGEADAFMHASVLQQMGHDNLPGGTVIVCDIAEGRRGQQVAAIVRIEDIPEEPPQPPMTDADQVDGQVKFFNADKGYGFVVPDEGNKDVFVSARVLERSGLSALAPNQRVRMMVRVGQRGPVAERVESLDTETPDL